MSKKISTTQCCDKTAIQLLTKAMLMIMVFTVRTNDDSDDSAPDKNDVCITKMIDIETHDQDQPCLIKPAATMFLARNSERPAVYLPDDGVKNWKLKTRPHLASSYLPGKSNLPIPMSLAMVSHNLMGSSAYSGCSSEQPNKPTCLSTRARS